MTEISDKASDTRVCARDCRKFLKDGMARLGVDVHVSSAPPIVKSVFEEASFRCPHGVTYWLEPTGEQIAYWNKHNVL